MPGDGNLEFLAQDINIVDPTTPTQIAGVTADGQLRVALGTNGTGPDIMLSIANLVYSALVTSVAGWTTIVNQTVPANKAWYLKSLVIAASRESQFRLKVGAGAATMLLQGYVDAGDSREFNLHGYEQVTTNQILLEMNSGAVNQTLVGNIIIYEGTV